MLLLFCADPIPNSPKVFRPDAQTVPSDLSATPIDNAAMLPIQDDPVPLRYSAVPP